ncbi:MAG: hypothetical protein LBS56_02185, partial [Propionibacteriaceae bacterium]|nr:hypothetical protein [Propionibacteriaceae bacterium]
PLPDSDRDEPVRRRWPIVAGVVVLLAALVGAAVFFGLFRPQAQAAGQDLAPVGTGLTVHVEVSAQRAGAPADVTVTVTAPNGVPVSGDVLVAFPDANGACPEVVFHDPRVRQADVADTCAVSIDADLDPGQSRVFTLALAEGPADNAVWLQEVAATTTAALSGLADESFAWQRVSGLIAVPQDVTLEADPKLPYAVVAEWNGRVRDGEALMSQDTTEFQATELLDTLTGGEGLGAVAFSTCAEAHVDGTQIVADKATTACYLSVRIGNLASPQARFAIA